MIFLVGGVLACKCIMPGTPSEEFGKYDYIFSGKVTSIGYPIDAVGEEAYSLDIVFNVSSVWKGSLGDETHIKTAKDTVSCGYPFNEGEEYLVYASGNESKKSANGCSRTKLLSEAQEDLAYLNNQTCIIAGEIYYPGTEKCCDGLKSIFGSENADGSCSCTEPGNNCGGSPICAPCGNGICESQYGEDKCNCAEDCNQTATCAKEGEMYSKVYSEYPKTCCEGLTEWDSGFDSRIVVNGTCEETGLLKGAPVGTCIKCGDGICGLDENVCNCAADCDNTLKPKLGLFERIINWFKNLFS